MPGRVHMKNFMASMYATARGKMIELVKSLKHVSITCDTWTSKANDSYTAVSAHGITNDWELKDYIVAVANIEERHTSKFLADQLVEILKPFEVKDPITVTDNGANIKSAIGRNQWPRFACIAHNINLAVRAGLQDENNSDVKDLLDKTKKVVQHFKHSTSATAELRKAAQRRGDDYAGKATSLVQEVCQIIYFFVCCKYFVAL